MQMPCRAQQLCTILKSCICKWKRGRHSLIYKTRLCLFLHGDGGFTKEKGITFDIQRSASQAWRQDVGNILGFDFTVNCNRRQIFSFEQIFLTVFIKFSDTCLASVFLLSITSVKWVLPQVGWLNSVLFALLAWVMGTPLYINLMGNIVRAPFDYPSLFDCLPFNSPWALVNNHNFKSWSLIWR